MHPIVCPPICLFFLYLSLNLSRTKSFSKHRTAWQVALRHKYIIHRTGLKSKRPRSHKSYNSSVHCWHRKCAATPNERPHKLWTCGVITTTISYYVICSLLQHLISAQLHSILSRFSNRSRHCSTLAACITPQLFAGCWCRFMTNCCLKYRNHSCPLLQARH